MIRVRRVAALLALMVGATWICGAGSALAVADPTISTSLQATLGASTDRPLVGSSFTITVTTNGRGTPDASFEVPLPSNLQATAVSITGTGGSCSFTASRATCSGIQFDVNTTRTMSITVTALSAGAATVQSSAYSAAGLGSGSRNLRHLDLDVLAASETAIGLGYTHVSTSGSTSATITAAVENDTNAAATAQVTGSLQAGSTGMIASAMIGGNACTTTSTTIDCSGAIAAGGTATVLVQMSGVSGNYGVLDLHVAAVGATNADDQTVDREADYMIDNLVSHRVELYIGYQDQLTGPNVTYRVYFEKPNIAIPGLTLTISAPGAQLDVPATGVFSACTGGGTATLVCDLSANTDYYAYADLTGTVPASTQTLAIEQTMTASGTIWGNTHFTSTVTQRLGGDAGLRALARSTGRIDVDGSTTVDKTITMGAYNAGTSAATGASVRADLPTGIVANTGSLPGGCSWAAPRVTCTLGDVQPYEYATVDVPIQIAGSLVGSYRVQANIDATIGLGASSDDTRRTTLRIERTLAANDNTYTTLQLRDPFSSSPSSGIVDRTLQVGERTLVDGYFYRIYPGAYRTSSDSLSATFVLPPTLTFVAGEIDNDGARACTAVGQVVTCSIGAPTHYSGVRGTTEYANLQLLVEAASAGTGSIQMILDDARSATDGGFAFMTQFVDVRAIGGGGDLRVADGSRTLTTGDFTDVVVPFDNLTAAVATGASLQFTMPTGASLVAARSSQGTCSVTTSTATCTLGDVPAGHSGEVVLTVSAPSQMHGRMQVAISSSSTDPVSSNNHAVWTLAAASPTTLDVYAPTTARTTVGETTRLRVYATSMGPNYDNDITVTYQLPANVTWVGSARGTCGAVVSSRVACTYTPTAPLWTFETTSITDMIEVSGAVSGTGTLAMWPSQTGSMPSPWGGGFATTRIQVAPSGSRDLVVAVDPPQDPIASGDEDVVRVAVRNRADVTATNAVLTVVLPAGLTHTASGGYSSACSPSGGGPTTLTCSLGDLPGGEYASVDVLVQAAARPAAQVTASVAADGVDSTPDDDSAAATVRVRNIAASGADLRVAGTPRCNAFTGATCIARMTVVNDGSSTASTATLQVAAPGNASLSEWRVAGATCSVTSGALSCQLGPVAAGERRDVRIAYTIDAAGERAAAVTTTSTSPADADTSNDTASIRVIGSDPKLVGGVPNVPFAATKAGQNTLHDVPVVNDGVAPQRIISMSITGADAARYTLEQPCDGVLAPGEQCTAQVRFQPLAAGTNAATLEVRGQLDELLGSIDLSAVVPGAGSTVTSTNVGAGGTLASEGGVASSGVPIVVSVTSPVAGGVVVERRSTPASGVPSGYSLLGQEVHVTAPDAESSDAPLRLVLTIDSTQIPAGTDTSKIHVVRNGVAITAACAGDTAVPSPCERSRVTLGDGDLQITVLTVQASDWSFGKDDTVPTIPDPTTNPDETRPPVKPADPLPTDPQPESTAAKLSDVSSSLERYRCSKSIGVKVGRAYWCLRIKVRARLVDASDSTAAIAGQQLVVSYRAGTKTKVLGRPTTGATGWVQQRGKLTLPKAQRRSFTVATAYVLRTYRTVKVAHVASGTVTQATATSVKTTVPSRLVGSSAAVQRYACTARERAAGVRQGTKRWCYRIVVKTTVRSMLDNASLARQRVRAYRVIGQQQRLIGAGTSNAKGVVAIQRKVVVPAASRGSLTAANKWLATQYRTTRIRHYPAGNGTTGAAATVTIRTRR